ncbi:hypothetical protein F5878DRAFT_90325 [Lentinula raphanica]|uniref:Uncharacterized protein n=1 Tax=Lentinula raphanica TaxID=153919 RepID=A0AA38PBT6_9AGAR|nr:hypothetical protein C8R42DRAFT_357858 [Lentinula raphanica]KAJ3840020.1 hypothetical protein F5878DRAFT_90325 [Lentinula raphanica]
MDFTFDSDVTAASTRPLFDYSGTSSGASTSTRKLPETAPESLSNPSSTEFDVFSFKNDGFSDFTLDLSCLSNPSSPASSPGTIPLPSEDDNEFIDPFKTPSSPSAGPFLPLPLTQQEGSPRGSPVPSETETTPSHKPSPITRATSLMRMSLPAMKYIGRGTPVDPGRRSQWGGRRKNGLNEADVTEDGMMLFSEELQTRSHSLDSHTYSHPNHRRSLSSEWQTVGSPGPRALSPLPNMDIDSSLERHTSTTYRTPNYLEPLPESSKIQIQVDSDPSEWDSIMKTVLGSSDTPSSSKSRTVDEEGRVSTSPSSRRSSQGPVPGLPQHPNGFDIVLGLNSALDLGLGLGKGMNFFDLGLIPDGGRDTPSVYSSAPESPERTPTAVIENAGEGIDDLTDKPETRALQKEEEEEEDHQERKVSQHQERRPSEDGGGSGSRSTTAETKAPFSAPFEPKAMRDAQRIHWWKKAVIKFKKMQKLIKAPSRT